MAMNFKYDGTTWAVSDSELPNYKERSLEQAGGMRRTFDGELRRHNRYSKLVLPFSWTTVGTSIRTHVLAISKLASAGTCTVEYPDGTIICKPEPGSYTEKEASYQAYNLGITLKEV